MKAKSVVAAVRSIVMDNHYQPGITEEQQLQLIHSNPQSTRDYHMTARHVSRLRDQYDALSFKNDADDVESMRQMVRFSNTE